MATFRSQLSSTTGRMPKVDLYIDDLHVPQHKYLTGFNYEIGVEQLYTATFNLFDPDFDKIEMFIYARGLGTVATFRFGWMTDAGEDMSPWYRGILKDIETEVTVSGSNIVLTVQFSVAQLLYVRNLSGQGYGGRRVVSDVVHDVCTALGIPPDKRMIEPTSPIPVVTAGWRYGHTFAMFLREMSEIATPPRVNSTGTYSYSILEDGTFVFSTLGYREKYSHDTYVYGYLNDGRVLNFSLSDVRPILQNVGGTSVDALYVDYDNKIQSRVVTDDPEIQDAGRTSRDVSAIYERIGVPQRYPEPVVEESSSSAEIRALQRLRVYTNWSYMAEATVLGDPTIPLRGYLRWNIMKPNGAPMYMSGYYLVVGMRHEISLSGYTTWLRLIRNAVNAGDIAAAGPQLARQLDAASLTEVLESRDGRLHRVRLVDRETGIYEEEFNTLIPGTRFANDLDTSRVGSIVRPTGESESSYRTREWDFAEE